MGFLYLKKKEGTNNYRPLNSNFIMCKNLERVIKKEILEYEYVRVYGKKASRKGRRQIVMFKISVYKCFCEKCF